MSYTRPAPKPAPTAQQARIARSLGVTPEGLRILARFAAGRSAGGQGAVKLQDQGYLYQRPNYERAITDEGLKVIATARRMGW